MDKTHTKRGKQSLILSTIGFVGSFFVPFLGTVDNRYWSEIISAEVELVLFVIFFIISFIGVILGLMIYTKEKDNYGLYAFIIGLLGVLINGFWAFIGTLLMMSSP